MLVRSRALDVAPFRLSGAVYAALLNHRPQLAALGEAVHAPPYKAPPKAPVLAVRPRHMLAGEGDRIEVPAAVEVAATLGIVIGRPACRVPASRALDFVAGYLVVGEIGLPTESHYRPGVRFKSRDGFCPLDASSVPASAVPAPDALVARVVIDDAIAQVTDTADRVRGVAELVADVSNFMTLQPGDVLTLGQSHGAPRAHAGQTVAFEIDGVGRLAVALVAEAA